MPNWDAKQQTPLVITNLADCPEFLEPLAQWHHQIWLDTSTKFLNSGPEEKAVLAKDLRERQAKLKDHLSATPFPSSYLAIHKGQLLGAVSLVKYRREQSSTELTWISNLFVEEAFRKEGIGAALLTHAIGIAQTLGLQRIYTSTPSLSRFYEKQGWEIVKHQPLNGNEVTILSFAIAD